ncbi:MAG: PP2C family protein-serine/threonine phosphatase [Rubripirellula sp.]
MSYDDEDTVEDLPALKPDDPVSAESFFESSLEIGAITHRGRVRPHNEDQFAIVRRLRRGEVLASSVDESMLRSGEESAWLLTVADGLGGQVSGEVASATAIESIMSFASEMSSWVMRPAENMEEDVARRVELYAQAIKRALRAKAESDPDLAGMATTLTAAYIYGSTAVVVNVGDSRSYLLRGDEIQQITRDHTLAQDLLDAGLSAESTRSYRNVLTRCFGTDGAPVSVDVFHVELSTDDRILLCSDGLTDLVSDERIQLVASAGDSTKDSCEQLVREALKAGGKDNITVVLARMLECVREELMETNANESLETESLETEGGAFSVT